MAQLGMPDLPPGNLRTLLEDLHELHRRAGLPSVRVIAKNIEFSHSAVHNLFTKPETKAPNNEILLAVVRVLASMSRGIDDLERVLDDFDCKWRCAAEQPIVEAPGQESVELASRNIDAVVMRAIQARWERWLSRTDADDEVAIFMISFFLDSPEAADSFFEEVGQLEDVPCARRRGKMPDPVLGRDRWAVVIYSAFTATRPYVSDINFVAHHWQADLGALEFREFRITALRRSIAGHLAHGKADEIHAKHGHPADLSAIEWVRKELPNLLRARNMDDALKIALDLNLL